MDQTKLRKNHTDCRHSDLLPSAQKPCNKKKSRHKNNSYQLNYSQGYDLGYTPYTYNLPPQARIHPSSQRLIPALDQSVCHYPVPLSFSLEHVSLPFYSTLVQPGSTSAAPLERVVRINRTNEHKIPGIFQNFKQNHEAEQDYMSLPPVNCDLNSKKSKDEDSTCKRRFSDPGVAQISSEEESCSRSSESSNNSLQDLHVPYAYGLIEQVNELRENNSQLTRELHEIKLEMESLKMLSASWKFYSDNFQPGKLADSIIELREAIKLNEEAFTSKMTNLFEKYSVQCNEAHRQLQETIDEKMNERLAELEEQIQKLAESVSEKPPEEKLAFEEGSVNKDILTIQQQLVDSEREKLSLRKELQEAIDGRKKAEGNTLRLERLVGVLRKKINGVSQESCMDEKQNAIRPLSSSFEQNPFIIANNKQSQKVNAQKRTMLPKKGTVDLENNDEADSSGPSTTTSTEDCHSLKDSKIENAQSSERRNLKSYRDV